MVNTINKNNQSVSSSVLESTSGHKAWYLDGKLHREDGPAIEYASGTRFWFLYGQLHRLDGPAAEHANGTKAWYYHGEQIDCSSQEQFERLLKLKALW